MNQRSHGLIVFDKAVVSGHGLRALEDHELGSPGLDQVSGLIGHVQPPVLATADDHRLAAVLEQLDDVVRLHSRRVMGAGLVPVPSATPTRPQLCVSERTDLGVDGSPLEPIYTWRSRSRCPAVYSHSPIVVGSPERVQKPCSHHSLCTRKPICVHSQCPHHSLCTHKLAAAEHSFRILNVRLVNRDATAEARIRDAALARFPRDGFKGTTVRAIAEDAGVSPALVLHHYGSKDGLRQSCDAYVVKRIRTVKEDAIESDRLTDPGTIAGGFHMAESLMRYLGWALTSGSEAAAELFDEMVEESIRLTRLAEARGVMQPSADLRIRCALQIAMQLGALTMQEHLGRAIGMDPLSVEGVMSISRATMELFSGAMFAPGQADAIQQALEVAIDNTRKRGSVG